MLTMYSCFSLYSIELSGLVETDTGNSCSPLYSGLAFKSLCAILKDSCYTRMDSTHFLGSLFLSNVSASN